MKTILKQLDDLYQKYNIPHIAADTNSSPFVLPIIGSMNAGKSSMLNAVFKQRLLPTPLISSLRVPFFISSGSDGVTVRRDGRMQSIGLNDLFNRQFDTIGIDRTWISLHNPFLDQLNDIIIADMPCVELCDSSLLTNLPAVVLVFAADEPAIKESLTEFFLRTSLSTVPLYVVVTKCDKVSPTDAEFVRKYLFEQIPIHLNAAPIDIVFCSKQWDVTPVAEMFLTIAGKTEEIKRAQLAKTALERCNTAISHLLQLLAFHTFTLSEIETQYETERISTQRILSALESYDLKFTDFVRDCTQNMLDYICSVLNEHMSILPQADARYIRAVLKSALTGSFKLELLPVIKNYLSYADDLIRIHGLPQMLHESLDIDLEDASQLYDIQPFIEQHIMLLDVDDWHDQVTPRIKHQLEKQLNPLVKAYTDGFTTAISNMIRTESDYRVDLLNNIRQQHQSEQYQRKTKTKEFYSDLEVLKHIKDDISTP